MLQKEVICVRLAGKVGSFGEGEMASSAEYLQKMAR